MLDGITLDVFKGCDKCNMIYDAVSFLFAAG